MEGRPDGHLPGAGPGAGRAAPDRLRHQPRGLECRTRSRRARRILERIERGTWTPPRRIPPAPAPGDDTETLHVTASRWWQRRQGELASNTQLDYRWRLDYLLAELAHDSTSAIDVRRVDDFREALVGRGLSARSVNMVLDLLAQILDDAVDYEMLAANPARGRRRRMRVAKPSRSFLEPDMVVDLLDAAGEWEAALPPHQRYGRRAFLALLCLSGGPRISEAIAADRGELDLHAARWRIPEAKTDAGERDVELTAFTLDELRAHLARRPLSARSPLFPTRTGGRLNASNVRNRLLPEVVRRANEKREVEGGMLLPAKVTPHTLRRTWAMLALTADRRPRRPLGHGADGPRGRTADAAGLRAGHPASAGRHRPGLGAHALRRRTGGLAGPPTRGVWPSEWPNAADGRRHAGRRSSGLIRDFPL